MWAVPQRIEFGHGVVVVSALGRTTIGVLMGQSTKLISLATSVPPHVLNQSDVASAAERSFAGRYDDFDRMARVFKTSGIRQRHAVRPIDWYLSPLGWPERTSAYVEGACQLFVDAATRALAAAELNAAQVDTIVTISSTGIATPSLEARVAGRMGFRPDVERVPVFGLGCAGGVSGFSIASRLARSRPGSIVLLVAVEVCTLAFRLDELTKSNIVATALFGDGAAACVLSACDGGMAAVEMSGQHTWPDTLDIMGWRIDPQGFGVIFDRAIPPFAQQHIAPAIAGILARGGLSLEDVHRFACHPGGAKVIAALERALALEQGSLDHEREVLADYGNMSSPTVLFVLDRILRAGLPSRTLLTAMGPGFTSSCVALKRAA
jgi:alkylresorcinol/alkylpyrone synthase